METYIATAPMTRTLEAGTLDSNSELSCPNEPLWNPYSAAPMSSLEADTLQSYDEITPLKEPSLYSASLGADTVQSNSEMAYLREPSLVSAAARTSVLNEDEEDMTSFKPTPQDLALFKDACKDMDEECDFCYYCCIGVCYIFHPVFLALMSTVGMFVFLTPTSPEEIPMPQAPVWNIILLGCSIIFTMTLIYGKKQKNPAYYVPQILFVLVISYCALLPIAKGFFFPLGLFILFNFSTVWITAWAVHTDDEWDDIDIKQNLKVLIMGLGWLGLIGILPTTLAMLGTFEAHH